MATQIQRRRGTTAQHQTFTGAAGEITVDTDRQSLVLHDGATVGGHVIPRSYSVMPQDFGAKADGTTDDSAAFAAAAAAAVAVGKALLVPSGTYLLSDVDLSSDASLQGLNVVCDADAFFTAPNNTTDIFNIGGQRRMNFIGGQFLKANRCFYTDNGLAPAYCRFERLRFRPATASGIKKCIEAETSVGNTFYECQFGWDGVVDSIDTCVDFLSSSSGETNVNRFIACTFMHFKDYGYRQRGSGFRKASNTFIGCWFEDSDGVAVDAGQNTYSLSFFGCYFEEVGSVGSPVPILFDLSTNVSVRECFFATPPTDITSWISVANSNAIIENNTAFVRSGSSQKFVAFGTISAKQRLSGNFLIDIDVGGDYEALLYSVATSGHELLVEWDIPRNSSTTTGDDNIQRFDPSDVVIDRAKRVGGDGVERFKTDAVVFSVDGTWYDMAALNIDGSGSTSFRVTAEINTIHQGVGNAARFIEVFVSRSGGAVSVTSIRNQNLGGGIELQIVADGTNAKLQGRRVGGSSSNGPAIIHVYQADPLISDRRVTVSE